MPIGCGNESTQMGNELSTILMKKYGLYFVTSCDKWNSVQYLLKATHIKSSQERKRTIQYSSTVVCTNHLTLNTNGPYFFDYAFVVSICLLCFSRLQLQMYTVFSYHKWRFFHSQWDLCVSVWLKRKIQQQIINYCFQFHQCESRTCKHKSHSCNQLKMTRHFAWL